MRKYILILGLLLLVSPAFSQVGIASWYGPGYHGKVMANGEIFNQYAMTIACNHLPLGTVVKITNLRNGLTVKAMVTDRGPFIRGRMFDVSFGVAIALCFAKEGLAKVKVEHEH
jgi:rare lipoprotein A